MEEFQSVMKTDGGDLHSRWSELLEKPNSKGWTKWSFMKHKLSLSLVSYFLVLLLLLVLFIKNMFVKFF